MPFSLYRNIKRNIIEDGMIVGSSAFLVRTMLDRVDFSQDLRILEIGSGKGAFTREIIRRMSPRSTLDVSEIKREYNPWIERLIGESPGKQVTLYNDCVTKLLHNGESYDVIVSSLPLKNFESRKDSNAFLHHMIEALKHGLRDGGLYLQYQYFLSNKSDIERIFGKAMDEITFVPLNILPAFVYRMTK
ncbi:MAG: methyltransferase domain-containing protein [Pseudomonadota bacterium]|nr:methyltransferase domain-containing protein [Pseudomonadota bacterium]